MLLVQLLLSKQISAKTLSQITCSTRVESIERSHIFCSQIQYIANILLRKNIYFIDTETFINQQHHLFKNAVSAQRLEISSEIILNQQNQLQTGFSVFGYVNVLLTSSVQININVQSNYNTVSLYCVTVNSLQIVQLSIDSQVTANNITSLAQMINKQLIADQINILADYTGSYVYGLFMQVNAQTQVQIKNIKMFGLLNGSNQVSQITLSPTNGQIQVEGTICIQIEGNICTTCYQLSMSTCCPFDAKVVQQDDFYSCSCIDSTKTIMNFDALNSTSCVCKDNHYVKQETCGVCPTDSSSIKNSNACVCNQQNQIFNTDKAQCDCIVQYTTKVSGVCQCPLGSQLENGYCKCTTGATMSPQGNCICPAGASISQAGTCECNLVQGSVYINNQCKCTTDYSESGLVINRKSNTFCKNIQLCCTKISTTIFGLELFYRCSDTKQYQDCIEVDNVT
ncbi:Hypothetical_protein [Hexamita inflata]|uniref:Hypothetical_protein n=1 Tax=Hexamita inflata TaxID=28002 RepID=A0ABP1HH59_9EUKA